jgi:hypothetical protein
VKCRSVWALLLPWLLATASAGPVPTAFRFEAGAPAELRLLWNASSTSRTERVACLASTVEGDTIRISRVHSLETARADSLGISAAASLEACGPPEWRGTVHTHVALRQGGRPYSLFSGADRGVMMMWWQRWKVAGVFCLLYSAEEVICEIEGPDGAVIFPRSRY